LKGKDLSVSTTKKVLIRRFDRESVAGFAMPSSYLRPAGVEILTPEGNFVVVPYPDVKSVDFVRDFLAPTEPERKFFNTRPKMTGLWVRVEFRDGDVMEGIIPNNLMQLETQGFTVIPPDPMSQHQRMFLPRTALKSVAVLGVVGSPLTRKRVPKPAPKEQFGLFDE
jgi:hypothetical protein